MTAKGTERAVFLDRDGCISPDQFGYISDPAGYSLYPYTGEALRILRDLGYQLFVVTNQSASPAAISTFQPWKGSTSD